LVRKRPGLADSERQRVQRGIARNAASESCREAHRHRHAPYPDAGLKDERVGGPLEVLLKGELVARVRAAIERLPPPLRVVAYLHWLQGLTEQAAADALHCPRSTVSTRISMARAKLSTLLRPWA
jgi:RNA polymerase sigma factor (sigma-70 family)